MTRERLDLYTQGTKHTIYDDVSKDAKTVWGKIKSTPKTIQNIWQGGKKIVGKK